MSENLIERFYLKYLHKGRCMSNGNYLAQIHRLTLLKYFLSNQNVPKGIKLAMPAIKHFLKSQVLPKYKMANNTINHINSMP